MIGLFIKIWIFSIVSVFIMLGLPIYLAGCFIFWQWVVPWDDSWRVIILLLLIISFGLAWSSCADALKDARAKKGRFV